MNVSDLIQAYFGGAAAEQLGRATGLDAQTAQQALGVGLPLQLDALADHAATAAGQTQIADAIQNLPRFSSVQDALGAPDGAANLQRAGELLMPVLLGGRADSVMGAVTRQTGAAAGGAGQLLQMALPLLLSFLGQRAGGGNLGTLLSGLRGATPDVSGLAPAGLSTAAAGLGAAGLAGAAGTPAPAGGALTASSLLDLLKAQFSGQNADRIGTAVGFGSGAQRATMAALPLVLNAVVNRGRTENGAADVMSMARGFGGLTDAGGQLNLGFLSDTAELGRVEGQGRSLLGNLFGNVDELTGRLGTALGGSGSNAGRLLSLMVPLVLSLLGSRAQAGGMNAGALSGLLGGLSGSLAGLLPAGLTGLSALLGATPAATTTTTTVTPTPAAVTTTTTAARPAAPVSTATTTTAAPVPPARRGGFPWWLIPLLLLLLLGGCWLLQPRDTTTTTTDTTTTTTDTGANGAGIIVENPVSDANLPAEPFTMSGKAPANAALTISDQGQEVGTATADADGNWSAELPAPTAGEHTYTVEGADARSEFKFNVTEDGAATEDTSSADTSADDTSTGTDTAAPATGAFAITAPEADATLPAGGFELSGTGTAGEQVQLFEDDTSLGNVTVGEDGNWTFNVPTPTAGAHTYTLRGADGTDLSSVSATIGEPDATASAANCTEEYSLSIADGQTVSEPFRFGGVGQGEGYSVTVKRGDRVIGTKDIPLDSTCGWSYQSRPGAGNVTYEVRPVGEATADPLSTVNLTVNN